MKSRRIIIVGGCGTIGKKLKRAWPNALTVDRAESADIRCDLADIDPINSALASVFERAEVVIHLATSADPQATDVTHFTSVVHTAKVVAACASAGVPKLLLASSDWAAPKVRHLTVNVYGHSKRVLEAMAAMYSHGGDRMAVAIRIGWVPDEELAIADAPDWLLENHWSDERLIHEFRKLIPGDM